MYIQIWLDLATHVGAAEMLRRHSDFVNMYIHMCIYIYTDKYVCVYMYAYFDMIESTKKLSAVETRVLQAQRLHTYYKHVCTYIHLYTHTSTYVYIHIYVYFYIG